MSGASWRKSSSENATAGSLSGTGHELQTGLAESREYIGARSAEEASPGTATLPTKVCRLGEPSPLRDQTVVVVSERRQQMSRPELMYEEF